MNIIFHRGGMEIGGNCIEIQSNNDKILLDVGNPITNTNLEGCIVEGSSYDGLLLSHAHIDHYGLLNRISNNTPVFCSSATKDILDVNRIFLRQNKFNVSYCLFESYKPFQIGSFEITPFLQDHSAFDSHGFVIKAEGKTIVYTGDFRNHGRKPLIYRMLIDIIKNQKVNLLIAEGTTLNREYEIMKTEEEIVDELVMAISDTDGLVMVCFSPQNIDRLVSIYKSARKMDRIVVIDIYTAYLLSKLSKYAKLPNSEFRNIAVYYPKRQIKKLLNMKMSCILDAFTSGRIFLDKIKNNQQKYIIMTRPSLIDELDKLQFSLLIYSMWQGYLKNDDMNNMRQWCINKGAQFRIIHTSGHTSIDFFINFVKKIDPSVLRIIHTEGLNNNSIKLKKYHENLAKNGELLII